MDPIILTLSLVLITIIIYILYEAWKVTKYWEERGIPHVKPWLFFGNSGPLLFEKLTQGELHERICNRFPDEPVVGYYEFMKPVLLIKNIDMVEKVLIKDFLHFMDHGFTVDEDKNPFDSNLFTQTGKRWKAFRNRLSPIFTTGKLKIMYSIMAESGDQLITLMDKEEKEGLEMREILGRFAMDVIGSCAFGIDAGNLAEPENEFRKMGKKSFEMDFKQFMKFFLITNFPSVIKFFNITFHRMEVIKYFTGIIKDTVEHRRKTGYVRNDFVQLMMQLQDKGYVEMKTKDADDDYLNIDQTATYSTEKFEMTNDQLTGQAFVFLTAGFEGTTIVMMYTLYEMCKNPEIQKKAREDVLNVVKQAASLTYDSVREMTYLEQCVKETMRKYPPAQALFRVCTKDYTLPNGFEIKSGQTVLISVKAVHYDPVFYPEPEKYKPERFDPDKTLPLCAFLPFGNGPRICIGMRFVMLEIKHCLAKLLMNYNFKLNPKTKEPLTLNNKNLFTSPNERVFFDVAKLNK